MPRLEADQAGGCGRQWGANQIGEHAKPEDVKSGKLVEVPEATTAGKPS
jgi:hypothetical protein